MSDIRTKDLETMVVLSLALLCLFLIFKKAVFVITSLILLLISLIFKNLTSRVAFVWLKFADTLGNINAKIILSIVFFMMLTPIALLYRVFVKNPMWLKRFDCKSYFSTRNHAYTSRDLENTW
ncbi:MAG: hypothetical protein HZC45_07740 [Deltaproteobacteria bacterium]|nr:hypothetical protein [Deltaproteobacteria bacterium]